MTILIDPSVGPFSTKEDIQKEIERVSELGDSEEVKDALEQLNRWLLNSRH